ncbi:4-hydroxyphenylpyruvate dioxygenase [Streptomyces violaceusniger]|uniref:4-hydroxyphenylpyruvate dioxygenase n=1 Tax=Streptomyces violaceusniger TaxID=68280 RepID=UPI00344AFA4C
MKTPHDFSVSYVEFNVRDLDAASAELTGRYGFRIAGRASSADAESFLLRQGRISLVLTRTLSEAHPAAARVRAHGDGVGDIAMSTADVEGAFRAAVAGGARPVTEPHRRPDGRMTATINGFGDVVHTLVEDDPARPAALPPGFTALDGEERGRADEVLEEIDHFAVCVEPGQLRPTVDYYVRAFGFQLTFEERISVGAQAMDSKVVQSASDGVTFTVIEPVTTGEPGQIDGFLKNHGGPGVQHVAFRAADIVTAVSALRDRGVEFLSTPDAYYRRLADRIQLSRHLPGELQRLNVLVDEDHDGQLFQIFTRSTHPRGTLFFEVIERLGARTFGSGNITALYEAVEAERTGSQSQAPAEATGPRPHTDRPTNPVPHTDPPVCLGDFAEAAAAALSQEVWDFVEGGSGTELTLAANRTGLDRIRIVPRVLSGGPECTTATRLVGAEASMPVAVAPMAYQRLVHPEGERATAAAAVAAGVPFALSMLSSEPVEKVTEFGGTVWFQLYWLRDRGAVGELVRRAEDAGCAALMVTVDVPRMGRRPRDIRNGLALPAGVAAAHLGRGGRSLAHDRRPGVSAVAEHTGEMFAPALSWDDLARLREETRLPLIVKGILDPRDAARAAALGADAVVVSNHGGRQLDGAVASVDMLPEIRDAVPESCRVLLDSGIRSGTDVVKALALGATGVLLGRPVLWGLGAGGADGVRDVLSLLAEELRCALTLAGCGDPAGAHELRIAGDPGARNGAVV